MKLTELKKRDILEKPIPMADLLKDSLYYPACMTDGRPIKYCNTMWRQLGIDSFVYCDFLYREDEFVADLGDVRGYHVLAHRSLDDSEWRQEPFQLELGPSDRHRYRDSFSGQERLRPYAHWAILERNDDRNALQGPKRFSLLYIGGEGLDTFQRLYVRNRIAPKMLCFIQCWGFAGNWTDFTSPAGSFALTVENHPECCPEWLCVGYHTELDGVLHLTGTGWTGARAVAYLDDDALERRFGSRPIRVSDLGEGRAGCFQSGGRTYLTMSLGHHMGNMVYDITDSRYSVSELIDRLILRERSLSETEFVSAWTGIEGHDAGTGPVLHGRVDLGRYDGDERLSKAVAVVECLRRPYLEEGLSLCTMSVHGAARWARHILGAARETHPELEGLYEESCRLAVRVRRSRPASPMGFNSYLGMRKKAGRATNDTIKRKCI